MREEFGERVTSMFDLMVDCLAPYGLINIDRMVLTPRGQRVADNWQQVMNQILAP